MGHISPRRGDKIQMSLFILLIGALALLCSVCNAALIGCCKGHEGDVLHL